MTDLELEEITNSHKWVKVKGYNIPNKPNDWRLQHELLVIHHRKETEFLIGKCKELAQELIDTKKQVPWSTHTPHKDEWGNTDWRDTGEMGG